jgi:predicted methyltransferase
VPLRRAFAAGSTSALTSLDLGRTTVEVGLEPDWVLLTDGGRLAWADVDEAIHAHNACFELGEDGRLEPIRALSPTTNRLCQLYPTGTAPTMLLAGFFMHRVKGSDPMRDTGEKLATLRPLMGTVLDTATGLGYTAIAAARTAIEVTTIELDQTVIEITRRNPWSSELFEAGNIRQVIGDAAALITEMPSAAFERIIHDPPVLALAGDLYGLAFYRELARVLRPGGRLFHYVGKPDSPSGAKVGRGVVRRLRDAGFERVRPAPAAFGYVAEKNRH